MVVSNQNHFSSLPVEILQEIGFRMDPHDLVSFSLTCKDFYDFFHQLIFWGKLAEMRAVPLAKNDSLHQVIEKVKLKHLWIQNSDLTDKLTTLIGKNPLPVLEVENFKQVKADEMSFPIMRIQDASKRSIYALKIEINEDRKLEKSTAQVIRIYQEGEGKSSWKIMQPYNQRSYKISNFTFLKFEWLYRLVNGKRCGLEVYDKEKRTFFEKKMSVKFNLMQKNLAPVFDKSQRHLPLTRDIVV